jgi:hypothetical protein
MEIYKDDGTTDGPDREIYKETPSPGGGTGDCAADKGTTCRGNSPRCANTGGPFRSISNPSELSYLGGGGVDRRDVMSAMTIFTRPMIPPPPKPCITRDAMSMFIF